jgi:hypothetical protein
MRKSTVDINKMKNKVRGRPVTPRGRDIGKALMVRVSVEELALIDDWIADQEDEPSRPEAVRRLFHRGLARRERK